MASDKQAPAPSKVDEQAAIRAASADLDAALAELDASLAEYIKKGDFSGFHLQKAKKAMAEGKYKDALYQARAALSHNPANAEARALRTEASKHK